MGTNYYTDDPTKMYDRYEGDWYKDTHIGKSSAGWKFLLNRNFILPTKFLHLENKLLGRQIWDEYGNEVDPNELLKKIAVKAVEGRSAVDEYDPANYGSTPFVDVAWHGDVWS